MLQVESLSKRYDNFLAVDDISFEVKKGEIVGLLGPNGAGKSTTMKIMTTFLPATTGTVTVNGFDVFSKALKVKESIGYLPESCPLYLDMKVEPFLQFVAEIRGISPREQSRAISKVISDCDLSQVIKKGIGQLSKGYRQRVGLAQALIHNPPVLILDEPTSGLDPNQIRDILKLIHDLGQEKTVIHSTHILSEVEATSNRVLIIHQGKIVGQGSPQELIAKAAGATAYISIKTPHQGNVVEKLRSMDFVQNVTVLTPFEEQEENHLSHYVRYAVQGKPEILSEELLPEKLFHIAVESNWSLQELQLEKATLDDVFAKLTTGGKK